MAWRTSLMQRASNSSVTITFGQTALISSSLVTRRPAFSTRQRNTSKLLGRKSTSRSAVRRQPCAISSVYSPNWNIISAVLFLPLRFDPLISDAHAPVSSNFREIAWFFQDWRSYLPQKQPQVQSANLKPSIETQSRVRQ